MFRKKEWWLFSFMLRIYHFLALNRIPQSDAHFSRFFMSFCRVVGLFSLLISLFKRQSSVNRLTDDLTEIGRTFMWHKNSIGPSTVPCGTLETIVASSEYSPSSATRIFLSVRQDVSHVWSGPLIPYWSILWRSLSWGTVSKAFEKSRIPMSTCFPLSNDCSMSCMVTTSCVSQE